MAIGFTLTPELEETRRRVREFIDEVHQMRIALRAIGAYEDHGTIRAATSALPI